MGIRAVSQRLTGSGIQDFPDELRVGVSHGDTAQYTLFRTQLTIDLQRGLDAYAQAFLEHHGIQEPVIWSPPAPPGVKWVGPELLDLDVNRMHTMLRFETYNHRRLADALNVSPRRVVRAIDAAPTPTVYRITHLAWSEQLPPRTVSAEAAL